MNTISEKYCFDTNCFIEPWNAFYPEHSHKSFWEDFIFPEIEVGNLVILEDVYLELEKKEDDLFKMLKQKKEQGKIELIEVDERTALGSREILKKYVKLVAKGKGRSSADPILIAFAKEKDATLVTLEKGFGSLNKPKIPDVCKKEKVKCTDLFEYMKKKGVSFVLKDRSSKYG